MLLKTEMEKLRTLNFEKLISIEFEKPISEYSFNDYLSKGKRQIKGFCTDCEGKKLNISPKDENYRLQNISHGATSNDIFEASDKNITKLDKYWKDEGVIFIMESPSADRGGFYEKNTFDGITKKPTKEWYWVHYKQDKFGYPQEFKGGRYGSLFNSIIYTFKLKNAYLTNLIKCGMNNENGKFKGIDFFNGGCIDNCFNRFLSEEIRIIDPKIIFCFGSLVLNNFNSHFKNRDIKVVGLPHPAGRRRGFKDEYYRHLYFSIILEGLYDSGVYSMEEAKNKFEQFLIK